MILLPRNVDSVPCVVLAAGDFPSSQLALDILSYAENVICCDGAAERYCSRHGKPYAIIGDCDSLDEKLQKLYGNIVYYVPDQETNDLTKAVNFCLENGMPDIVILGATGRREDHTVANIALMAEYVTMPQLRSVRMVTDFAVLDAVCPVNWKSGLVSPAVAGGGVTKNMDRFQEHVENNSVLEYETFMFESFPGEQISIFTPLAGVRVSTNGLRYPLNKALLQGWWTGTLNEATDDRFTIALNGPALIYRLL